MVNTEEGSLRTEQKHTEEDWKVFFLLLFYSLIQIFIGSSNKQQPEMLQKRFRLLFAVACFHPRIYLKKDRYECEYVRKKKWKEAKKCKESNKQQIMPKMSSGNKKNVMCVWKNKKFSRLEKEILWVDVKSTKKKTLLMDWKISLRVAVKGMGSQKNILGYVAG